MKRFTITGEWHGSRLDRFVRVFFPGMPFSVIQILLRKGLIYLNGSQATGNVRLTAGDVVAINIAEADENGISPTSASPKARARRGRAGVKRPRASSRGAGRLGTTPSPRQSIGTDIPVLYEDDALLIIDKPAGLVVHPGNRWEKGSLLDLLEEYRRMTSKPRENSPTARAEPSRGAARDAEPPFRYTPVHRLDRETSGALIVAKTRPAARALSRSIARGTVLKTYIAVVEGIPVRPTGEISTPLRTRKTSRSHSSPAAEGKEASTRYTTLATFPGGRTMLEVSIRRGRTHQIRAHLGSIGHPIVGDEKYGASANVAGKILLHAWKVQLPHPVSETTLVIEAAPPKEFKME
jgi:RluA family pseudouridine synthase